MCFNKNFLMPSWMKNQKIGGAKYIPKKSQKIKNKKRKIK